MNNTILGLHHITAIAGNPQRNYDFYTKVLGLRLVKKTVNFDDPGTYHFYYGNETGSPGTILTFFPWEGMQQGHTGTGMATEIGYSVPVGSIPFWQERFRKYNVKQEEVIMRFGEESLLFRDPDGLKLTLISTTSKDQRKGWNTTEIKSESAIKGFYNITLTLKNIKGTASILTDIFNYKLLSTEGNRHRYFTDAIGTANRVDLLEIPDGIQGLVANGTNHHVAFRVEDEKVLMEFHHKIASAGFHITNKIDRNYFYSLYFREPGGVLFEIATDNPGFAIDEPLNELGTHLKLPVQFEKSRKKIEEVLPVIAY